MFIRKISDIDRMEALDVAQKVKVKWIIEGDENNKYFHGTINKKGKLGNG